ncbi:MAG TPA: DUF481 domain-containing protein [Methylophilaceae bacterium]|nr:DUF481 domain-containing protein [Methylophilaceae bacterium]
MRLKHPGKLASLLALCLTVLCGPVMADQVKLKNGDMLTGEIVKKETTTLIFRTSYAGELSIQWSEIESLNSDKPVHIVLSDGSSLRGELAPSDPGNALIRPVNEKEEEKDIDLLKTRYINPTPDLTGEGIRWTGNINAGGTLTQGNTETKGLRFDGETIARTLKNRYTVGGVFNRMQDRGRNTQFNSRAYGKFDHFLTKQWYAYANTFLENDRFRDLRLRSTVGVGNGYQIFETPNLNLAIEGGLSYVREDYYIGQDNGYPGARWAIRYDQMLFNSTTKLFHDHEVLVNLENTGDVLVFSKTGLRFPLIYNFNATAQYNLNWDNTPSPGRKENDSVLLFTVGYGW